MYPTSHPVFCCTKGQIQLWPLILLIKALKVLLPPPSISGVSVIQRPVATFIALQCTQGACFLHTSIYGLLPLAMGTVLLVCLESFSVLHCNVLIRKKLEKHLVLSWRSAGSQRNGCISSRCIDCAAWLMCPQYELAAEFSIIYVG